MSRRAREGAPIQLILTHADVWLVDVEAGRRTYSLGTFETLAEAAHRIEQWTADRGLELQSVVLLDCHRRYQRK